MKSSIAVVALVFLTLLEISAQHAPGSQDVGIGATGSFQIDAAGAFVITDTGSDIWGDAD